MVVPVALADARKVPLAPRREDGDQGRVVGARALAGGGEAFDVEASCSTMGPRRVSSNSKSAGRWFELQSA